MINRQRARLFDILNRHVSADDDILHDRAFVVQVFRRWAENTEVHIGDPGDGVVLHGDLDKC